MKYALIIGNDQYTDEKLPRLEAPVEDARELAKVLGDKMIGEFYEVESVINKTTAEIRKAISRFLRNKKHDDLVLLYFSGHGVLDNQGRLHLASNDTETGYLAATAISASFVKDELSQCRSQRQILILDCCHSGAVERGVKAAITEETFEGGYGRVILTASTETQLALEGNKVLSQTEYSLFTHFLLEGLKTGDADKDNDGIISLDEWYSYAYTEVTSRTHKQTPQLLGKRQGELFIAKNSNLKKKLPPDLVQLLESRFENVKVAAIEELSKLVISQDTELSRLASERLGELMKDENRVISSAARKVVEEIVVSQAVRDVRTHARRLGSEAAQANKSVELKKSTQTLQHYTNKSLSNQSRLLNVFLCYAHEDKVPVREIYQKLNGESWIQSWFDEIYLPFVSVEVDLRSTIRQAMKESDVIIVCVSRTSINKMGMVQNEIDWALEFARTKSPGSIFIIPVCLDDVMLPYELSKYLSINYFGNRDGAFQSILQSLRKQADSLGVKG